MKRFLWDAFEMVACAEFKTVLRVACWAAFITWVIMVTWALEGLK